MQLEICFSITIIYLKVQGSKKKSEIYRIGSSMENANTFDRPIKSTVCISFKIIFTHLIFELCIKDWRIFQLKLKLTNKQRDIWKNTKYFFFAILLLPDNPPTSIFFKFLASKITTVSLPAVGTYRKEKQMSPSLLS